VAFRCLIVDDNHDFLTSAAQLLGSQGVEIVGSASSTAEALRLARMLEPDVALVDIELGDEDGIELSQELAARVPATHVVLISAYERDDLVDLLSNSPAIGFLPKRSLGVSAIERLLR